MYVSIKKLKQLAQPAKKSTIISYQKKCSYKMQMRCYLFGLMGFESPPISPTSTPTNHEAAGGCEMGNCQPDSYHIYNQSSTEAKTK